MIYLVYSVVFIYGLIFGSFYNVCISRIPVGLSIIYPPSHCPNCKGKIAWYQNIPLVSWLVLRGKCGFCSKPISIQYPLIELFTGVLTLFVFIQTRSADISEWAIRFFISFIFCSGLLISSIIDIKFLIIPNRFTVGGAFLGVFFSTLYPSWHGFTFNKEGFIFALMSAIICAFSLELVRQGGKIMFRREAMGMGDVRLVAAFGAFLGWKLGLISIFFASLVGSVFGILSIIFFHRNMKSMIPFGPYLAMGAFISMFWGEKAILWYLNFSFETFS